MLRLRREQPSIMGNPLPNDPDGRCEADVLIVGGDATPGIVVVSKAGLPFLWDKRNGYGYAGAWLVFKGTDLAEFDTTITIWRDDQKQDFDVWKKKYLAVQAYAQPQQTSASAANRAKAAQIASSAQTQANAQTDPAAKNQILSTAQAQITTLLNPVSSYVPNIPKPKALGVANPILAELGIKSIVPKHIGQWVQGTGSVRGKWTKTISWYQWGVPVPLLGRPSSSIDDTKKKVVAQDPIQLQIRSKIQTNQATAAQIAAITGHK